MKVLDLISNAIYIMEISYLILWEKGRIKLAGVVLLDLGRAPVFLPPNQAHSIFGLTSQSARPPYKIPSQLMKTLDLANSSSRWRLQLREDWAPWSSSHQVFRLCGSSQGDWWAVLLVLINFILLTCSPLTHGSISWICYLIFLHQLFFFLLNFSAPMANWHFSASIWFLILGWWGPEEGWCVGWPNFQAC